MTPAHTDAFGSVVRPAPRTDGYYRAEAEREYAALSDGPVKRAKIADFITYLRKIDGAYCKNSTITARAIEPNDALVSELLGDAPVSEARLLEIERMYGVAAE